MKPAEYPALYQSAGQASERSQSTFFGLLGAYLLLSVIGSAFTLAGVDSKALAIAAAVVFLAGLALSIYIEVSKVQGTWYSARAVAESVKTAAWRFVMRAPPFTRQLGDEPARRLLIERLRAILGEHSHLGHELGGSLADKDQVTEAMLVIRARSLQERSEYYRTYRILEQRAWYSNKSAFHRKKARIWFAVFVTLQAIAILILLTRIASPEFKYWPAALFASAAGAALTWLQANRYKELAATYGLTAHEIGLAAADFRFTTESELERSVDDTENAFSREHTQWIARKSK